MKYLYKVKGLSTADIRAIVKMIRKKCGLSKCERVPVCGFFEWIMEKLFPDFEREIAETKTMGEEGVTLSGDNKIIIREDVYEKACNGDGRARFTIMHEIGHFVLHRPERVVLCRFAPKSASSCIPSYEDPEWQANTFAAEFLMDYDLVKDMDFMQISKACCVTYGAAKTRVEVIHRRQLM